MQGKQRQKKQDNADQKQKHTLWGVDFQKIMVLEGEPRAREM